MIWVFDLDDTLALTAHRTHLLPSYNPDSSWDAYFLACGDDAPNTPVLRACALALSGNGPDIRIVSGRGDVARKLTLAWLHRYLGMPEYWFDERLTMRTAGDLRHSAALKRAWFDGLTGAAQRSIEAVFEDRSADVAMWRGLGLTCFQVAKGDF